MALPSRAATGAPGARRAAEGPPAAAENGCVVCHAALGAADDVAHDFEDWRKSPHARSHVSCDACHGGDPSSDSIAAAHAGLRRSTDTSSPLYFTRIPDTCGRCHAQELAAFRQSAHAKELSRTGGGPNCVTCHGAMANTVLRAKELEKTCALCHRTPMQAAATLRTLDAATDAVKRLKAALDESRRSGRDAGRSQAAALDAEKTLRRAVVEWHTFRMEPVRKMAQDATRKAREAEAELRVRSGRPR